MSRPPRILDALTLAAFALLALSEDADARRGRGGRGDHEDAKRYYDQGRTQPLERILEIALVAAGGGEVIEVEFEVTGGRPSCEVKIIDRMGRIREVHVDAETGQVLKVEHE